MKTNNIINLINRPSNLDLEIAKPFQIRELLENQMLIHSMSDQQKNLLSFRTLNKMKQSNDYIGIRGIQDFQNHYNRADPDNVCHMEIKNGKYVRSQIIVGSVKRMI